jgi:retron-type reverse transcriptase
VHYETTVGALEDKIVQQAVVTILNQIYEVDFKGFSYGFRPGRSPHQALDALTVGIQRKRELGARCRHPWLLGFIVTMLLWLIEEAGWRVYYSDA